MNKINILHFGEMDLNELEDYYESQIDFKGQILNLDLNLDDGIPPASWYEDYTNYINQLDSIHQNIRNSIKKYYPEEGMVKEFYTYHLEEVYDDVEEELKNADKSLSREDQLLSILSLQRIGFYFDEQNFATWDFMLGDFSDQILVIITDKDGKILDITWES